MRLARGLKGLFLFAALVAAQQALALDPERRIEQYKHTRWTTEEGAPQNVRALAQTADGYLWIGSDTGLYRFDGVTFELISPGGSMALLGSVTSLYVSRSGDLWAGYISGRIRHLRGGQWRDAGSSRIRGPIWQFAEDRAGTMWIVTGDFDFQLGRLVSGAWTHAGAASWGLPVGVNPASFTLGQDGTLWLALSDRVFFLRPGSRRFEDTGITNVFSPAVAVNRKGEVWISDGIKGTRRLPDYPSGHRTVTGPAFSTAVQRNQRQILFDREGSLWGATSSNGIFRIARPHTGIAREEIHTATQGLTSNIAGPLLEDREGNMWFGTTNGLDRFRTANVVIETGIAPRSQWGYVLFADSRGTIYAVDSDTAYRVRPGGKPEVIRRNIDNPMSLCESPAGSVWMGSNDGILAFGDRGVTKVQGPPGRVSFLDCMQTSDGRLWFASPGKGLHRFDGRGWRYFAPEALGSQPNIILADRQGGLLASARRGDLRRIDFPFTRRLWAFGDMPGGEVRVLYQGSRDVLIGSAAGLARLRDGRIEVLRGRHPWSDGVAGIVETPEGETWVLATKGIARLSSGELAKAFGQAAPPAKAEIFDLKDGLPPTAPFYSKNSATRGGDGRLWFVTSEAIVWIDPSRIARNALPPPVSINALVANGSRYRDPTTMTLARGTSSLEIGYTALSLSIPERVRFRYRLEGADTDWTDPGTRRQAFYTNLGAGTYRFRVIAANNDGVWNREGATLQFTIPPTFLQSNWFVLLSLLGVGALLWLAYTMRVRQLTARVRSNLMVRLAERERIARELHDTLLQSFQGLVLRFQSVAERIPQNQPLRPIVDKALDNADSALEEARTRVRELRAAGGDLAQALVEAAEQLTANSPTRFAMTIEGHPRELHPMVRDEVEHVGVEAIRNAFRHARARDIEAVLTYRSNELRLDLRDDGVGLPADLAAGGERDGHYGLTGMRERAQRIGGTLTVNSRKDAGTEVRLSVPARAAYVAPPSRWRLKSLLARWRRA